MFADLAAAVADGADAISGIAVLGDREDLHGPVASMPTTWRVLDRVDADHLGAVRDARTEAREAAWAAGAGPDLDQELCLDFDATITIAHSEKENAAATGKKTFGFHPLQCFLDRPDVAGGEALAGLLRQGNAGSNTAADHIMVLDMALAALPEHARPGWARSPDSGNGRGCWPGRTRPAPPTPSPRPVSSVGSGSPTDSPGTHGSSGSSTRPPSSVGTPRYRPTVATATTCVRAPGWPRPPALIDLSGWPERLILRKERPHPGAQLTFTDVNGHRITAILTNIGPRTVSGQSAGLELRHRQHARVEDRIREAKATGCATFPAGPGTRTTPWLEVVLTAVDLVCWTKQICFADVPELARCEIAAFRYRVLHVAARLVHAARRVHLRIDKTWRWAAHIAAGFHRLRAAFT